MRARLQLNFAAILMIGTAIASSQLYAPSLQAQESDAKSTTPAPSRLSSPFRRAIQRGLEPGGDIVKELRAITDRTITSRRDAEAVINALASLTPEQLTARRLEYDNSSPLFYLAMWFECINYSPSAATTTFAEKGIPQLIKCYDAVAQLKQKDNEKDLIYLLALMVAYKSPKAADRIVEAARKPLAPFDYSWSLIFESLAKDYPDKNKILAAFSEKLPAEPLAIRLLQFANDEMANEKLEQHPFDSPAGYALLNQWLSNTKDADLSMAALSAIPFLVDAEQEQLLEQAVKSPFKQIRLRGATHAAEIGFAFGFEELKELCTDVGYSKGASDRLRALDRADLIPKEISEPEFLAKAKLSHWLQVNTERSDAPSEMKILDSRVLTLPAESKNQTYYLIQFRYSDPFGFSADETYVGLVGKNVYCAFDFDLPSRPIEDIYALYATYLAKKYGFMEDLANTDRAELSNWLPQWKGPELTDVVIRSIITLDRKLDLPNYKIALGTAQLNGEPGWIIFDGSRSTWYPMSEQPKYESISFDGTKPEIPMIHVGRLLLDFSLEEKGRPKHLAVTPSPKPPAEVLATYTRLLNELPKMSLKRQREYLDPNGPISSQFDDCVNALSEVNGSSKEEAFIQLYEQLFASANLLEEPAKTEALSTSSPVGEHFLTYIKSLLANNRRQDALEHCSKFESRWTPYYGFSLLAQAYILAGAPERAEPFLAELFDFSVSSDVYVLEAGLLAELWKNNNEIAKSQKLLIDCLKQLRKRMIVTNRINFNATEIQKYQDLHKKFLELYPDEKSKLDSAGLPADPTVKP
ncbi:MAG: hypothetical protein J0M26_14675 [Planctomycetes bacterium]|nr:hypothetical protein [Planctomycetota bacterium]